MPLECETSGKPPARSRSFHGWHAGSRDPSRSENELRRTPHFLDDDGYLCFGNVGIPFEKERRVNEISAVPPLTSGAAGTIATASPARAADLYSPCCQSGGSVLSPSGSIRERRSSVHS